MKIISLTWNDTETHQAFFLRIRYSRIASCTEFFKNINRTILWLCNKVQLDQTFKILSYNGSAYFQPRNKKVLEKINELPSLTNWLNPTDWTKIIQSTINYTDSVNEKERFSTQIDKSRKRNPKKLEKVISETLKIFTWLRHPWFYLQRLEFTVRDIHENSWNGYRIKMNLEMFIFHVNSLFKQNSIIHLTHGNGNLDRSRCWQKNYSRWLTESYGKRPVTIMI